MPNPWFKMSSEDRLVRVVQFLNSSPIKHYTPRHISEFYLKKVNNSDINTTRTILIHLFNLGFVDRLAVEQVGTNVPVYGYKLITKIPLRKGLQYESKNN